jgi:hypothetical protein
MEITFLVGLLGSITLVSGAFYPDVPVSHPLRSVKNWLFALGALTMLIYSTLNYFAGGSIFFIFLQGFVSISSAFMMLNVNDRIDTPLLGFAGLCFIVASLYLFEGYNTVFFILGLSGIGMGFAMQNCTFRRDLTLALGGSLIALFSFIEANWLFFWLNVFFASFSGYHAFRQYKRLQSADVKTLKFTE